MEYEDEPMDVNETAVDSYIEEGEISSSSDEKNITVKIPTNVSGIFSRNLSKDQTKVFVSGLNVFDQDETRKKLDRAKRFSLPFQTVDSAEMHKEKLSNLYKDLRIDKENERHYRFNAIHMRGTENMSTEDVLQYFISYAPSHVEWINDFSCNIVWSDDVSAARALLNLSKKVKNLEKVHLNTNPFEKDFKSISAEHLDNDDAVDARIIKTVIPPGFWRIGVPCEKSSSVLLRYATRSDKKHRNAERNSDYYKKYGNPHFGNIPGIISNSFRTGVKKSKFKTADVRFNWEKPEEQHLKRKNPWEELAYEWGKIDKVEDIKFSRNSERERIHSIPDLRISLKNKKERPKRMRITLETAQNSLDKEAWESRSKIPRMKMYADDEEERLEKYLEKRLQSHCFKGQLEKDLRSKINRNKNKAKIKFIKLRTEKKPQIISSTESIYSESEYDDGDSGDWALEHYHDLRESLEQNKRQEHKKYKTMKYESDDDDDDDDDNDNDNDYKGNLGHRSPLQIEIENDEYYFNKNK